MGLSNCRKKVLQNFTNRKETSRPLMHRTAHCTQPQSIYKNHTKKLAHKIRPKFLLARSRILCIGRESKRCGDIEPVHQPLLIFLCSALFAHCAMHKNRNEKKKIFFLKIKKRKMIERRQNGQRRRRRFDVICARIVQKRVTETGESFRGERIRKKLTKKGCKAYGKLKK